MAVSPNVHAATPAVHIVLANVTVLWPGALNRRLYLDLNSVARQTAWAHGFMHAYALWLGLALLAALFVVAVGVMWRRGDARAVALLGLGGAGTIAALGINQLVGHAAKEVRPYDTYRHALVLVGKANDYAFPSDHAVVAGGLVVAMLLVARRTGPAVPRRLTATTVALGTAAAVLGLLLCFARVYVGAHYPGDVVAGFLLGAAVVLVVSLLRPMAYRLVGVVEPTRLGVLVRRPGAAHPGSQRAGRSTGGEPASVTTLLSTRSRRARGPARARPSARAGAPGATVHGAGPNGAASVDATPSAADTQR